MISNGQQVIDVIIPVYRDVALTRACIESVLTTADPKMGRVLVINDASPEQAVTDYCEALAAVDQIELIIHENNVGFVATVNEGMRATENDVVLLNSDTEVSGNWLSRLHHVVQAHPDCATVTPFSNNATICSFPVFCEENPLPSGMTLAETDALFAHVNAGKSCEIPTGVGFCMYVTRVALDRVGDFDEAAFGRGYGEENDFCRRAVAAGFKHYHAADIYVQHKGGVSFAKDAPALQSSAAKALLAKHPDYDEVVQAFIKRDPAKAFRERVSAAMQQRSGGDECAISGPSISHNGRADPPLSRSGHPLLAVNNIEEKEALSTGDNSSLSLLLVVMPNEETHFKSTWDEISGYPWADIVVLCSEAFANGDLLHSIVHTSEAIAVRPVLTEPVEPHRYWTTVLPHLSEDGQNIFVLRCGTQVPSWLYNRLLSTATSAPTWLFPFTAIQPFSRIFNTGRPNPRLNVHEVDAWFSHYRLSQRVDLPLLAGYSAMITPPVITVSEAKDDRGLMDELKEAGAKVLLSPEFYVDDSVHEAVMVPPELPDVHHELVRNHPRFAAVRQIISTSELRFERAPDNGLRAAPVTLHICHSWGGGLNRWAEDYGASDFASQNLILKSVGDRSAYGKSIALFSSQSPKVPIKTWALVSPIISTAQRNEEYGAILRELADNFQIKQVLVSSLIGHSLEVLSWHAHTTFITHDFYPLCPPLYAKFGTICDSCQPERFRECLRLNEGHQFFSHESPMHLTAIKKHFLQVLEDLPIRVVSPSRATRDRWQSLTGSNVPRAIDVIPHGLQADWLARLEAFRHSTTSEICEVQTDREPQSAKLKVLVLGRLFAHKGSEILLASLSELADFAELHLLGSGDEAVATFQHKVDSFQAHYDQADLPSLIAELSPDVAIMLSIVPETFSYTAEELQLMGIPLVATGSGSLIERFDPDSTGWQIEPTPESLISKLSVLQRDRKLLADARQELMVQPAPFSAADMVDEYQRNALPTAHLPLRRAGTLHPSGLTHESGDIYVRPDIPVRRAVLAFMKWLRFRVAASPRLPAWCRRLLR